MISVSTLLWLWKPKPSISLKPFDLSAQNGDQFWKGLLYICFYSMPFHSFAYTKQ